MKDKKTINHEIKDQIGPKDIGVIEVTKWTIASVGTRFMRVKEVGGDNLETRLPLDIFKDQLPDKPDKSWVGKTVKLVHRQVTKPIVWESWEL